MAEVTDRRAIGQERARLGILNRIALPLALAGLILLLLLGFRLENLGWLSMITNIMMFVVLAEAWNLLGGYGGYLNLGMAVFFGLGAYTTAILFDQLALSPFLMAPLGGVVAVLFALVIGLPSLRLRGPYFAVLTLVIGFLAQLFAYNSSLTRGARGIYLTPLPFDPRTTEQIFFFIYLGLMLLATAVAYKIEHSKYGCALIAIREDEDAAEILGVRTTWLKMAALLIGAMIAGVAGGIYSYRISYLEPLGTFSLSTSVDVVLMTVVGGAGTWPGPLIGVSLVMFIGELLRVGITRVEILGTAAPNELNRLIFGLILLLVALNAEGGAMGLIRGVRGRRFSV